MAKNQAKYTSTPAQRLNQTQRERAKRPEPATQPDSLVANLLYGPVGVFGQETIENQIALMRDPRLSEGERHLLAEQIGQVQGNLQLQRVIALNETKSERTSAYEPEITSAITSLEGNQIVQRWNSDDHESITNIAGNRVLSDPLFVSQVGQNSALLDFTAKRIFWTGPRFLLGIDKGEGPEHGEDGNYSNTNEESARSQNLAVQNHYRDKAVQYHREFEARGQQGESVHSQGEVAIKSAEALGNACHIAQDRGSHGEGVKGRGHDDPRTEDGWNPDDKRDNTEGYQKAIENTIQLFEEWKRLITSSGQIGQDLAAQRQGDGPFELDDDTAQQINRERSGGQPLDGQAQAKLGGAMGQDFSGVKVHTSPTADQLNRQLGATAFTTGQDIFFRQGAYAPQSSSGQELLAHELTHVVQQSSGAVGATGSGMTVNAPGDVYEQEADAIAQAVTARSIETQAGQMVARQEEDEENIDEKLISRQVVDDELEKEVE